MMEPILGVGVLLISLCLVPGIAFAALGPVNKAAGAINAPTRFQISDLLWLSALLQAVLAFCIQAIGINIREAFVPICGFMCLTVVAIWAAGVSFLSRAGVACIWKRACLLLVSLPGTLGMMMGVPCAIMVSGFSARAYLDEVGRGERAFDGAWAASVIVMGIAVVAALSGLAWGLRRLSFWIVSSEEGTEGQPVQP
jgi:hypothetical protein